MNKSSLTFAFFLLTLFSGCVSGPGTGQRVAIDSLATGVGGTAAYFGSEGDPALTTAGAVGGFVVSEAFQAMAHSGRRKAYNSGVEEGKAIGQEQVLKALWEESNGLPRNQKSYQPLLVPFRVQNGVRYDAHTAPPQSIRPERVFIPGITNADVTVDPHYEQFQKEEP
jgi:hypothetical protein